MNTSSWRTIQYAAANVQAGDIVTVRGGVYNEAVTMQKSGSASNGPITFQSYPGELATFDGTGLKTVGGQSITPKARNAEVAEIIVAHAFDDSLQAFANTRYVAAEEGR